MESRDLTPLQAAQFARDRERVERGLWRKLWAGLGRLPFLDEALAAYYCAGDRSTPLRVKVTLMAALAYFVVPSDLVPDFVAGLGYTDDATVLFAAVRAVAVHITPAHRRRAAALLACWRADGGI